MRAVVLLLALTACDLPPLPPPRNCEVRTAYYPDEDGDGLGEPTAMYVGCAPPPGWVSVLGPDDTEDTEDTEDTSDTGSGA